MPFFMSLISSQTRHQAYTASSVDEVERRSDLDHQIEASAPRGAYSQRHPVLSSAVKTVDIATILIATVILASTSRHLVTSVQLGAQETADLVSVLVTLSWPKGNRLLHLPELTRLGSQIRYLSPAVAAGGFVHFITLYLLGWTLPSAVTSSLRWSVEVACGLAVVRAAGTFVLTRRFMRHRLIRKVAILGDGAHALRLAERLRRDTGQTFAVLGVFSDDANPQSRNGVSGSIADLVSMSREHTLHGVVIALPSSAEHEQQVKHVLWTLRGIPTDVYILPHLMQGPDMVLPIEALGPVPLIVLQRRPLTEWQVIIKLALDLSLGTIALLVLFPLMLAVACAIKLDSPGPVLFRQVRLGLNNRPFMVYKFRSMYAHMTDHTAMRQTGRNDLRITRIGKWLRKFSIDELPQLLNVLRNEMSLVGPRPHAPDTRAGGKLLDDALAEYVIRHQIKPGITGWAQVNGSRGELVTTRDLHTRVTLDLEYMQRWSIWFDLKIMILTILREVVSHNSF